MRHHLSSYKERYFGKGSPEEYFYSGAYDLMWKRVDRLNIAASGKVMVQGRNGEPITQRIILFGFLLFFKCIWFLFEL